jgi:HD-like signal output (HDOD) protein
VSSEDKLMLLTIRDELSTDTPSINKIINLIKEDIALLSKIIKILNSTEYNLSEEITSIEHAIKLLGINNLKNTIINPAYQQAMNQTMDGFE